MPFIGLNFGIGATREVPTIYYLGVKYRYAEILSSDNIQGENEGLDYYRNYCFFDRNLLYLYLSLR